ncbi:hypothetical protein BU24DRAFT_408027 [Aaosphaeria arxii CBS 175.79]|uniref:DUF1996 domain-containing protein n=1 Tax=Aaosphaeria arxii CBS 175.79 TaxID=1450172 RepID=A0A6A5Y0J1_9PLEO|nr:uncharacterized protein BU24DRAFT_408027 [Aaosphaeria arxii CBS 175.79]KAF2018074.1 hypothetical protein BU24DRAFT_408027 [Aaosphaeria arxii CBS 175.79]
MSKFIMLAAAAGLAQAYTNTDVGQFMLKNIDPIVMPGEYKSHMHSFFGSDTVTKDLPTSQELRAGCSTAKNPNDFSVYWVPTLYHVDKASNTRTAIKPKRFTAYYNFEKTAAEVPIPENYNAVAGNADATSVADVNSNTKLAWLCEGEKFDAGGKEWSDFPLSTCSKNLQVAFFFQDCVNSETLESAYSSGGKCPEGMKTMPQLRFSIRYDVKSAGSWKGDAPFELACGASHCMHGDFINGWLPETAKAMVTQLTEKRKFQSLDGPNGKTRAGTICKRSAVDQDPKNGTSDYEESLEMMKGTKAVRNIGKRSLQASISRNFASHQEQTRDIAARRAHQLHEQEARDAVARRELALHKERHDAMRLHSRQVIPPRK